MCECVHVIGLLCVVGWQPNHITCYVVYMVCVFMCVVCVRYPCDWSPVCGWLAAHCVCFITCCILRKCDITCSVAAKLVFNRLVARVTVRGEPSPVRNEVLSWLCQSITQEL